MKNIFQVLFLVFCLFTTTNALNAQWVQTNGPYGEYIACLAVSPNGTGGTDLFAGTNGGVFLSTNNGTSWTAVNNGLPKYPYDTSLYVSVNAFAVSGTNLFAGTNGSGVFLSTNNGTSWTAASTGLTNIYVWSLAVSPNGTGGTNLFSGSYGSGVFLSTNNGTSWTAVNNGLPKYPYDTSLYVSVNAFAVSGTNLFAGTYDGVFLSTNNGTSWTEVDSGLTTTFVRALVVSPNGTSGTNLFAGTIGTPLYKRNPGGGVFLSTNNGTSWTAAGLTDTSVYALAVSPNGTGGTNLFASTGDGVFLSTNNGISWSLANTPFSDFSSMVAIDTNLFAGNVGVYLSTNNGTSWIAVNNGLPKNPDVLVYAFAVSGTNLFAGTGSNEWGSNVGDVFLSTNNGTSWTAVNTGLTNTIVSSLAVSPNGTGGTNLFAGTYYGGVWRRPLSEMTSVPAEGWLNDLPQYFSLSQNYPNPFNPSTTIPFSLPSRSFVSLKVFDLIGREVATVVSEELSAGSYTKQWNASNLPSGVYFCRLSVVPSARRDLVPTNGRNGQSGTYSETKKLLLLK